ncbi:MAG TPA: hypothetical protein VJU59_42615 [Paraburkholderia sp.]|jgi:glutamate-1-semialdehyde 2,1-aminomutase|nr:hypothetical protein [Paraburkholderia sp.]HKR46286.1 hypothetical protein [Paraburkholderia sp.]
MQARQGVNQEREAFVAARSKSQALSAQAARHLLFGVPIARADRRCSWI